MNDKVERFLRHPATIPTVSALVAFSSGIGVGYFYAQKKIEKVTDSAVQLELDFNTPALNDYIQEQSKIVVDVDALDELTNGLTLNDPDEEETSDDPDEEETSDDHDEDVGLVRHTIFSDDDDWDHEAEVLKRTKNKPYILHRDEFHSNESAYYQQTLTYYEKDDILCDENDVPVYNYHDILGDLLFGHGSADSNVVYIRNDKRRAEYEILKHTASYSETILGLAYEEEIDEENELKHSTLRKFKSE